jgi:hypothetical protein
VVTRRHSTWTRLTDPVFAQQLDALPVVQSTSPSSRTDARHIATGTAIPSREEDSEQNKTSLSCNYSASHSTHLRREPCSVRHTCSCLDSVLLPRPDRLGWFVWFVVVVSARMMTMMILGSFSKTRPVAYLLSSPISGLNVCLVRSALRKKSARNSALQSWS